MWGFWRSRNSKIGGFTLIEVMVVLLIVAAVMAMGGSRFFNPNENRRGQVRSFAIQTRELRTNAKLQNVTLRLAIAMDETGGHKFWVESANGHVLQLSSEQVEELSRLTQSQREEALKTRPKFQRDPRHPERKLTGGLKFLGVELATQPKPITEGVAYINFFPAGLSDEAIIKMGDGESQLWSIVVHPLTGAAKVYNRAMSLKDLRE